MAGHQSRNKGSSFEREVIRFLQPIVDEVCQELAQVRLELQRDNRQRYQAKNYDVIGVPWMALECKHHKRLSGPGQIDMWWRQTLASCRDGQTPILIWKLDYQGIRVRMRVPISVVNGSAEGRGIRVRITVDLDWPDFLVWFRIKLKSELTKRVE